MCKMKNMADIIHDSKKKKTHRYHNSIKILLKIDLTLSISYLLAVTHMGIERKQASIFQNQLCITD
jgi:hypothetical protein